jgi:hypothetical protein
MPVNNLIQLRRGTAAQWVTADPVLESGEAGFETDTGKFKIGDGATDWVELSYAGGSGVAVSATEPEDPEEGALWFNSSTGITSIYFDSEWVELSLTGNLDGGKANSVYGGINPINGGNAVLA